MPADIEAGVPPSNPDDASHHVGRRARRRARRKEAAVGVDATLGELAADAAAPFGVAPREVARLTEEKDHAALTALGGPAGLAAALATSPTAGIDTSAASAADAARRAADFGPNRFKTVASKSFFRLFLEALRDPILILLMAAAAVSTVLGAAIPEEREQAAYSEGIAIWVAVLIVSLVASGNDYQKDLQFRKLNAQKDVVEIKVIRNGKDTLITNTDLVVGDVVRLITGDKIAADGVLLAGQGLVVDEASLTGESDPIKKCPTANPWLRCGTQVSEGSGTMLVTAVGVHSEWGRTMAMVVGEAGNTPLQEALTVLAQAVGKVGLAVGVLCFIVLMIRWMVENRGFPVSQFAEGPLRFFIFAITIIVVAVPEGLPLAVTISLAYSMRKMMKDNNFVRVLAACETMGGATAICSDKTGTLTENRMTVVAARLGGKGAALVQPPPGAGDVEAALAKEIHINAALNSKAFLIEKAEKEAEKAAAAAAADAAAGGKKKKPKKLTGAAAVAAAAAAASSVAGVDFVGNRTECALLLLLRSWGVDYRALRATHAPRVLKEYDFSSERKMASVLLAPEGATTAANGARLYAKGAAEIVVRRCVSAWTPGGGSEPLSDADRAALIDEVTAMAATGLRTIGIAHRDLSARDLAGGPPDTPPEDALTLVAIVGIKDPVRAEVPDAVATCQRAGITVRMVTGDNVHTARHIARECGILTDGLAMEGPTFRALPEDELIKLLPRLQVLARSSPADKLVLVRTLKKMGEIVAVTGDGTNDAPALKESDVGMAMGIAGTEVSKEAADIVIMDDNFSSIVKAVMWGRSVFCNIRKFLQFQLTVNFVALVVAFVAAVTSGETPLNVMQLLWVNLIMDALAALALATEDPSPKLLLDRPHGRSEPLISGKMWKHIITQGLYQMAWLFLIVYGGPAVIPKYKLPSPAATYGAVDLHPLGAKAAPLTAAGPSPWRPAAPSPPGFVPESAACTKGPCFNACCVVGADGFCVDNLVADGGNYRPTEKPLCALPAPGADAVTRNRARRNTAQFCDPGQAKCDRSSLMAAVDAQADKQYHRDLEHHRETYSSLVFNAFIFMQLFNEINARKINDELNVFDKIWRSPGFLWVIVVSVACQLVIMLTPLGRFFKVLPPSAIEWGVAVAAGAGSLVVAFVVKLISRLARHMPTPRVFLGDWTVSASLGRASSGLSAAADAADDAALVRPPPPSPSGLLRSRHKATAAAAAAEWTERGGDAGAADAAAAVSLARRRQSIARAVSVRRPGGARVAPAAFAACFRSRRHDTSGLGDAPVGAPAAAATAGDGLARAPAPGLDGLTPVPAGDGLAPTAAARRA